MKLRHALLTPFAYLESWMNLIDLIPMIEECICLISYSASLNREFVSSVRSVRIPDPDTTRQQIQHIFPTKQFKKVFFQIYHQKYHFSKLKN